VPNNIHNRAKVAPLLLFAVLALLSACRREYSGWDPPRESLLLLPHEALALCEEIRAGEISDDLGQSRSMMTDSLILFQKMPRYAEIVSNLESCLQQL